jgi:hypothetical protein
MPAVPRFLALAVIGLALAGATGARAGGAAPLAPAEAAAAPRPQTDVPLPSFDRSAYCFYAGVNSSGVYDRKKCFDDEERSAILIAQQWTRMPREAQITCSQIARDTGRSYFILKACLRNFARATWSEWQEDAEILDRSQQIAKSFRR